ncbi:Tautomerase/MIF [Setomelanomma holmii]|uniref:L-dopachrome isomerase n=1 Tax=Setomelanomma holmii TaxID=210430 RepID=A0A9P4LMF6_9PLEO|nr:Tautomerase/MIF [Setomelanomma holmii]
MPHSVNNSISTQTKMSRPSSTSTQSGNNAFPKQAGAQLLSPKSEQLANDGARHLRPITRGTTGDSLGDLRPITSRSRAQYYEDSFSYKDGIASSARERVTKDAPIIAELRTNVIIKDEYTLVTDLSHHLSTRYQRPEASIMITVNHSACLLLGGSFEPTYVLVINALPVQLQPTTNKRNAALIQQFMSESIGVTPDRGIIKFVPIPEESLATNGMTILGEIERLERQQAEETGTGLKRAITKSSRKSAVSKAKSSIQLSRNSSKANTTTRAVITPAIPSDGRDSGVAVDEKGIEVERRVSEKKSEPLMPKFAKRSNSNVGLAPPPVSKDRPTKEIGKRKSFMSVFRR